MSLYKYKRLPAFIREGSAIDCRCTALFNKALIGSLSRINKDGGSRQPSLESAVTTADRQDKLLLPNLSPYANHTSRKERELRRSLHLVALAGAAELEEVKEELRNDTGMAERRAKEDRREPQKRASSQKWVSREVRRSPGTLRACVQMRSRYPPSSRKTDTCRCGPGSQGLLSGSGTCLKNCRGQK